MIEYLDKCLENLKNENNIYNNIKNSPFVLKSKYIYHTISPIELTLLITKDFSSKKIDNNQNLYLSGSTKIDENILIYVDNNNILEINESKYYQEFLLGYQNNIFDYQLKDNIKQLNVYNILIKKLKKINYNKNYL
jgi:hypothetical protein